MKYIAVLFICLMTIGINGQNVIPAFNREELKPAKGVKEYYENIRLAENSIVKNDTTQAIRYYAKAFEYKSAFFYDYINAWKLYNEKPIVDSLLLLTLYKQKRLRYGADFDIEKSLDDLIKDTPQLNTSFVQYWRKNKTIQGFPFNTQQDTSLTKHILALADTEQKLRLSKGNFAKADSSNLNEIINIYNKYGDLSEQNIGHNGMQSLNGMLFHISRYPLKEWIPIITEQTLKGNFPNKWYAELIDEYFKENISKSYEETCFKFRSGYALLDKYLILKVSAVDLNEVNLRRSKFFLDSYQEQQQKQLWNFRNGNKILFYAFMNACCFVFTDAPQEYVDSLQEEQVRSIKHLKDKYGDNFIIFNKKDDNYDINLWK